MLAEPSARLIGAARPFWSVAERECPLATLVCAVCPGEIPESVLEGLLPQESEIVRSLDLGRAREWVAGRLCLAAAIARLSPIRVPLLPTDSGAPAVPHGIAGSISHKGPLTMAIAATTEGGIGIDVECAESHDAKLVPRILTSRERMVLEGLGDSEIAIIVAAHFAVKEAVYKALSPEEQYELDFEDVELGAALERVLTSYAWVEVATRIRGRESPANATLFLDGEWVVAVARRA